MIDLSIDNKEKVSHVVATTGATSPFDHDRNPSLAASSGASQHMSLVHLNALTLCRRTTTGNPLKDHTTNKVSQSAEWSRSCRASPWNEHPAGAWDGSNLPFRKLNEDVCFGKSSLSAFDRNLLSIPLYSLCAASEYHLDLLSAVLPSLTFAGFELPAPLSGFV